MEDNVSFIGVSIACGVATLVAAARRTAAGRPPSRARGGRVLFVVGGALLHVINLVAGADYSGFADPPSSPWVTSAWQAVVVPHAVVFIGLLALFEAVVGVLAVAGGRATQIARRRDRVLPPAVALRVDGAGLGPRHDCADGGVAAGRATRGARRRRGARLRPRRRYVTGWGRAGRWTGRAPETAPSWVATTLAGVRLCDVLARGAEVSGEGRGVLRILGPARESRRRPVGGDRGVETSHRGVGPWPRCPGRSTVRSWTRSGCVSTS